MGVEIIMSIVGAMRMIGGCCVVKCDGIATKFRRCVRNDNTVRLSKRRGKRGEIEILTVDLSQQPKKQQSESPRQDQFTEQ